MDVWDVTFLDDEGERQLYCVSAESVIDACLKTHQRYHDARKIVKVEQQALAQQEKA